MSLTATPPQETAAPSRRPHLGTLSTCTLRHASDDRLVALTRGGSERAFAEVMRRYERPLHYYCLQMVGAARAEDAVQQTFMQAFVALRDGEQREIALRPWLYRIARNCAIDLLRKQHEHDELDPDFDGMLQTPGVFEQKEELARVVAAIQALPEGQRRALTLRELEGRSYGEISAVLGHTDSGVRQLIFRARTALRNLGALVLPLGSMRWRVFGAPSTAALDPHGVAVAAGSSTGGGALQAAGTVVAATLTLLGTAPAPEHHAHASARPALVATAPPAAPALRAAVPLSVAPKPPRHPVSHARGDEPRPEVPALVVPAAATIPVLAPAAPTPAEPPPADPPALATAAPDVASAQVPEQVAALGGISPAATPASASPGKSGDAAAPAPQTAKPAPVIAVTPQPKLAPAPKAQPAKPALAKATPAKPAKPAAGKPAKASAPVA